MRILYSLQAYEEGMQIDVVSLSPEDATRFLGNVKNGSKIDPRAVKVYSEDMQKGLWKLNGEPVIIGSDGQVLSGRLRLHACVIAGVEFATVLIRGVSPTAFDTIDAIRRRTHGDILTIRREKYGRALAASIGIVWRVRDGSILGKQKQISSQTLLQMLEDHPELRTSTLLTRDVHPILPHGVAAALHYIFSSIDSSLSNHFFQILVDPEYAPSNGITSNAPLLLRQQMKSVLGMGGARSQSQIIALTIKAWEAFRRNRNIGVLKLTPDEKFPEITDLVWRQQESDFLNEARGNNNFHSSNEGIGAQNKLRVKIQLITPEFAAQLLERNDGNRKIVSSVVEKYARDMRAGNWKLNGQTIKIASSGRLIDGQHRCAACVVSSRSFEAFIVENLDEGVFDTFDLGARRAIGDILKDMGEENYSTLAATLRQAWLFQNGFFQLRAVSPTVSELLSFLSENPQIRTSAKIGHRIRDILAPAIGCAMHFFFAQVSEAKADEFVNRLGDGNYLYPHHPVSLLRDKLFKDRISRKRTMSDAEKAALIIKAWNAFYQDRSISQLKWQNAGPNREMFPTIMGLTIPPLAEAA